VLIIALGGYAGYNFWNSTSATRPEASGLYDELAKRGRSQGQRQGAARRRRHRSKFGSTAYAPMAALSPPKARSTPTT
jgi:predicted negative regulator of RcsB-dependent stress response